MKSASAKDLITEIILKKYINCSVAYKFGIVAMASGLIGVPLGSYLAQRLRLTNQKSDPLICGWGLFISAPMVFMALVMAASSGPWCIFFVLLAQISLNMCWSIVADILLVSKTTTSKNPFKSMPRGKNGNCSA